MLQAGTTVKSRKNLNLKAVVVGTYKGIPCLVDSDGNKYGYSNRDWQITSDNGGESELDTRMSDLDTMRQRTTNAIVKMAIEDATQRITEDEGIIAGHHAVIKGLRQRNENGEKERNELKQHINDLTNPTMRYRISMGTEANHDITEALPISFEQANTIAANLSRNVRRNVIVEHVEDGVVVYASLWRNGKPTSDIGKPLPPQAKASTPQELTMDNGCNPLFGLKKGLLEIIGGF